VEGKNVLFDLLHSLTNKSRSNKKDYSKIIKSTVVKNTKYILLNGSSGQLSNVQMPTRTTAN